MKAKLNVMIALILVVAAFAKPSSASAGGGLGLKFRGPSAMASFLSSSGCDVMEVFVIASQIEHKDTSGPATFSSFASVTVWHFDSCADTLVRYAYGTVSALSPEELQISKKLDSARLQTTIPVFDEVSGASFDLAVDLSWAGVGPLGRQQTTTHFDTPGCIINSHFQGRSRPAQAWGSVSDGTLNYTPELSVSASLDSVKSGTVVIGCN